MWHNDMVTRSCIAVLSGYLKDCHGEEIVTLTQSLCPPTSVSTTSHCLFILSFIVCQVSWRLAENEVIPQLDSCLFYAFAPMKEMLVFILAGQFVQDSCRTPYVYPPVLYTL